MADKISTLIDPVALADRLRTAAQEMAADNCHDWAFLADLAADALVAQKAHPEHIAKLFEVHRADLQRCLPAILDQYNARKM